jgi:hypothetical protein
LMMKLLSAASRFGVVMRKLRVTTREAATP